MVVGKATAPPPSASATRRRCRCRRLCLLRVCLGTLLAAFVSCTVVQQLTLTGLWCLRTEDQIAEQCRMMRVVSRVLSKAKVRHWLCFGSALAAFRDRGVPIPWETDDDLCLMADDAPLALRALQNATSFHVGELDVSHFIAFRVAGGEGELGCSTCRYWIDVHAHRTRNYSNYGGLAMVESSALRLAAAKFRDVPHHVMYPLRPTTYCGASLGTFHLPHRSDEYLRHTYGEGYREVSFATPSNGYRAVTCRLWKA